MKKNLPSFRTTLFVFCGVLALSLSSKAQTATAPAGSGTSIDPYQIGSLENLYWIAENTDRWDDYYQQTANIDASATSTWFSGEGWTPIGDNSTAFTGNYDGGGYTISNLYMNRSAINYQGLFGYANGAYISNLGIEGADITGKQHTGCLVGWSEYSTVIYRCWALNSSLNAETWVGGLTGYLRESEVNQCFTNVTVTASSGRAGCLVGGANSLSTIENSYGRGSVDASPYVGGIVGLSDGSQMINCYSTALIDGFGGGLVGYNWQSVVDSCYWDIETSGMSTSNGGTGKTTSEMKNIMTFVNGNWDFKLLGAEEIWNIGNGRNDGYPYLVWQYPGDPGPSGPVPPAVVLDSISDLTSTTATANGNITVLGIPNASQHGVCWNTTGAPTISDSKTEDGIPPAGTYNSYITGLTANTTYYIRAYATNDDATAYSNELTIIATDGPTGDGTEGNPYQIASLVDLFWMSQTSTEWGNTYWIQTANIDASETSSWNGGKGFKPVGNFDTWFYGSYKGNHYKISGLTIDRPTMDNVGLFGYTDEGIIEEIPLENVAITGKDYVGGLVGATSLNAVIDSCSVQGTISGEDYVGGFCGRNRGNISNSSSNTTVNGVDKIGGFVGNNFTSSASIKSSFSLGSVTGNNQVGGFVGFNSTDCRVENCYSRANVTGNVWCGGFAGDNYYGEIYSSYSTGSVSGNSSIGGFIGFETNSINANCFWDTETSGMSTSIGGTGKTTAEMKALATYTDLSTTGLSNAWDFTGTLNDDAATEDVWAFAGSLNDGYPLFSWEFQTLNYETSANGSISGTTLQYVYEGEDGTAVEAVPDEGYHFVEWSDGITDNPRTDLAVMEDVAVTASFAINVYTLSYAAGDNGTLSGNLSQDVEHGNDGTAVEAIPNTGYHFVDWSDGSTENPRTDLAVTEDLTFTANFAIKTYTLTYTAGDNGSITGTSPQEVDHGSNGSAVTAVPATGYHFAGWSDGGTDNPRTDENVTADIAVTANFEINTYTLTYSAGTNGSISGDSPQTVDYGSDGSEVEALPDDGYTFVDWSDGSTDNPRTDVNVTADISVTANFAEATNVQEFSWAAIEVYPNPFGATLQVSYPQQVVELKVLNIIGQTMITRSLDPSGKIAIPTQELQAGVYLLIFRNKDGDMHTRRLLKK